MQLRAVSTASLLLLGFLLTCPGWSHAGCMIPEECPCAQNATLRDEALRRIREATAAQEKFLLLDDLTLTRICRSLFGRLPNLSVLMLNHNDMPYIPGQVFGHAKSLATLSIGYSKVQRLDAGAFWQLGNLTHLYLVGNLIQELHRDILWDLTKLETLDLHQNRIEKLDATLFAHTPGLLRLDISSNKLHTLPHDIFDNLFYMTRLTMNGNSNLTTLPSGIFKSFAQNAAVHCDDVLGGDHCLYNPIYTSLSTRKTGITPAADITTNTTTNTAANPTSSPTTDPTARPATNPTASPVTNPTASPATNPTASPTTNPTASPATNPTASPATNPTASPATNPTASPATNPTASPATNPTASPATNPTASPATNQTAIPATNPTTSHHSASKPSNHSTATPSLNVLPTVLPALSTAAHLPTVLPALSTAAHLPATSTMLDGITPAQPTVKMVRETVPVSLQKATTAPSMPLVISLSVGIGLLLSVLMVFALYRQITNSQGQPPGFPAGCDPNTSARFVRRLEEPETEVQPRQSSMSVYSVIEEPYSLAMAPTSPFHHHGGIAGREKPAAHVAAQENVSAPAALKRERSNRVKSANIDSGDDTRLSVDCHGMLRQGQQSTKSSKLPVESAGICKTDSVSTRSCSTLLPMQGLAKTPYVERQLAPTIDTPVLAQCDDYLQMIVPSKGKEQSTVNKGNPTYGNDYDVSPPYNPLQLPDLPMPDIISIAPSMQDLSSLDVRDPRDYEQPSPIDVSVLYDGACRHPAWPDKPCEGMYAHAQASLWTDTNDDAITTTTTTTTTITNSNSNDSESNTNNDHKGTHLGDFMDERATMKGLGYSDISKGKRSTFENNTVGIYALATAGQSGQ